MGRGALKLCRSAGNSVAAMCVPSPRPSTALVWSSQIVRSLARAQVIVPWWWWWWWLWLAAMGRRVCVAGSVAQPQCGVHAERESSRGLIVCADEGGQCACCGGAGWLPQPCIDTASCRAAAGRILVAAAMRSPIRAAHPPGRTAARRCTVLEGWHTVGTPQPGGRVRAWGPVLEVCVRAGSSVWHTPYQHVPLGPPVLAVSAEPRW